MSEWTERNTAFSKALTDVQIAYVNAEIAARDLQAENAMLRELARCLVYAEHPSDRATLIANAADMLAELGVEVES